MAASHVCAVVSTIIVDNILLLMFSLFEDISEDDTTDYPKKLLQPIFGPTFFGLGEI